MQVLNRLRGNIVFLTGFMASGKSYFGKKLADFLQMPFHDLDHVIEQQQGKSISSIFQDDGEEAFRKIERTVLEGLVANIRHNVVGAGAVVATGGGAPCYGDNMAWMNRQGVTLWLNPPFDVLIERLSGETDERPLVRGLKGPALAAAVRERLQARELFYRMATIVIDDPDPDPSQWQ